MAKKRQRRVKLASLIVVGEGACDKAFLNHMKDLYDSRETNQSVKVMAADGGSPRDIIRSVVKNKQAEYDKYYLLMDSDIPLTPENKTFASKNKVELILSTPLCLEGMLLDVLGQKAANNSQSCKAKLHPQLSGAATEKLSYRSLFPEAILTVTQKAQIIKLRRVLANV